MASALRVQLRQRLNLFPTLALAHPLDRDLIEICVEYGRTLLSPATWSAFAAEQRMLMRDLAGLQGRLGQIRAPTTIVVGTADRIVTPASARQLADQIAGAQLVALERASHLLLQERPSEVAELMLEMTRSR